MTTTPPLSMYERVNAVLQGRRPDRHPFVTRLEAWYKSHSRSGTLPDRFRGMSLRELHQALGVGQLKFRQPFRFHLRGVEVSASLNGEVFYRQWEPVVENFPGMWDIVSTEKPGETSIELRTAVGRLSLRHVMLPEGVFNATDPYLKEHLIKSEEDDRVVEYILERLEYIPAYAELAEEQARLGSMGFVVPLLLRIPFQQVLLEYLGETNLFYSLYDCPERVKRLLKVLDEQMLALLDCLAEFHWAYVEFPDNLHGLMTNPRLFREYCLPAYQRYTAILHAQGKRVGSHTDGDVKLLLSLLKDSGLDVCESFSPAPLTSCTFAEAWEAWQGRPLIWGGLPSPIFEDGTSEEEFRGYIADLLERVGREAMIFGVVDLLLRHNSIARVEYVAQQLESRPIEV